MALQDVRARKAIVRAHRAAEEAVADLTHAYGQTPAGAIFRARAVMSAAVTELGAALREHDEAVEAATGAVRGLAERVDQILHEGKPK
jgi:hypothetical protein